MIGWNYFNWLCHLHNFRSPYLFKACFSKNNRVYLDTHHCLLYLVVNGHDAGSGRAAREENLINIYPKPSVLHTNVGHYTKPPEISGKSTVFFFTTPGLCEYAVTHEHPSTEPPSQRGHCRLQVKPNKGDIFSAAIIFLIYLLSSLRCELSALSSDDRKEMEKFRSWQTPRSMATE